MGSASREFRDPAGAGGSQVPAKPPAATLGAMSKTLVIAEKPSVGGDLARVLKGPFKKQEGFLEGPEHVVTWAVGHLVQLADPDEYDPKFKTWRMPDLPIVPEKFKLVVRDERSRKQMSVVTKQLGRDDVDEVVNACDAGREGELIFAYLYEKANAKKPVQRLWLNSMTNAAMKEAFKELRPASEFAKLEQAARSRSEADWIVGMNATRAATIRLRSSFDGAVSLGRVQTPTLAIVARREEEIRAFKPEPYWLVDATFAAGPLAGGAENGAGAGVGAGENGAANAGGTAGDGVNPERSYIGRFHAGAKPRIASEAEAVAVVEACEGKDAKITKLEKKKQKERAPMLYDLTTLQREANTRYGFSARRTLAAAQRLYEEHKALTYPRTNSRYLTTDMIGEIKPIAELVGGQADYRKAAEYVTGLDELPLARVVNNEKVTDHHAIIPTRSEHNVERMGGDDKRVYDMAVRRFLAVFHPEAEFENTKIETTVPAGPDEKDGGYVFRTRGKLLLTPGWRGVYGEAAADAAKPEKEKAGGGEEDEGANQQLPRLEQGEDVETREIKSARKETKPPRRYSDASLLGAMETAGKLVDDEELQRGDEGLGHRHPGHARGDHRALDPGRLHRARRALAGGEREGVERDQAAERARADLARTDRQLGAPAGQDRARRGLARGLHGRHRRLREGDDHRARRDAERRENPPREARALPDLRARDHREPQGLLVLGAQRPGLRLRDLEEQSGQDAADHDRARTDQDRLHLTGCDRLQRPQRPLLPRAPGDAPDRGGQMARGVQRGVGQGGRKAPGRRDGDRGGRGGRAPPPWLTPRAPHRVGAQL